MSTERADRADQAGAAANGNGNTATPLEPQNLEAEEAILGAIMLAPAAILAVREIVRPESFYRASHGLIYRAALALAAEGKPCEAISIVHALETQGKLDEAGGRERIFELAALVPSSANAAHWATIVRENAIFRQIIALGQTASQLGTDRRGEASQVVQQVTGLIDTFTREQQTILSRRAIGAAEWLEQSNIGLQAVWGKGDVVLWAEGEPLMIYGPDGVGKTSICQQLVLHLAGVRPDGFLGLPCRRTTEPILYVSADRPKQARRSLHRMVDVDDYPTLDEKILVWEGPLPFQITDHPRTLQDFCELHGARTLILDSLKDVAVDLSKEESASRIAHAFQWLSANGVDLCVLHHPRKPMAGEPDKPRTWDDVYGNRLLTGGFGSGLLIWGKGGDLIVDLIHLKQPAEEYGPKQALHDHARGVTELFEEVVLAEILVRVKSGLTVANAASHLFATDEPDAKQREKARRRLERMVKEGDAYRDDDDDGTLRYRPR